MDKVGKKENMWYDKQGIFLKIRTNFHKKGNKVNKGLLGDL